MDRRRSDAVLVGLSALGFRRSALCVQDAADGSRARQNLQRQRPRAVQALKMARHIVARTTEIPPGGNKVVAIDGRDIVVFHVNGEFFAWLIRCPHEGAPLDKAACVARLISLRKAAIGTATSFCSSPSATMQCTAENRLRAVTPSSAADRSGRSAASG